MKILSVTTQNFKKLGDSHFNFTDGTNLVTGDNAAGKTTLLNAILVGLFGVSSIASDSDNIPTWGYKKWAVEVETDEFKVCRTHNDCKIFLSLEKVAQGNKPCTEWVKSRLGMDANMFDIFCMSRQGETSALVTLGATKLNQVVENYSGVGVLDKVIKSISKKLSYLTGQLAEQESALTSFKSQPIAQEDATLLRTQTTNLSKAIPPLRDAAHTAKTELGTIQERLKQVLKYNAEAVANNESISEAKGALDYLASKLKQAEYVQSAARDELTEYSQCTPSEKALKADIDSTTKYLEDFNTDSTRHTVLESSRDALMAQSEEIQQVLELREQLVPELEALTRELEKLSQRVNESASKKDDLLVDVRILSDKLGHLEGVCEGEVCRTCKTVLTSEEAKQRARDILPAAKDKLSDAKDKLSEAKLKFQELRSLHSDAKDEHVRLTVSLPPPITADLDELRKDLESTLESIATIEARWTDFDAEAKEDFVGDCTEKLAKFKELNDNCIQIADKIADLSREADVITQSMEGKTIMELVPIEDLDQKAVELVDVVADSRQAYETADAQLARCEQRLSEVVQFQSDCKEKAELVAETAVNMDRCKRLGSLLKHSRTEYLQSVWTLILAAASGFVAKATDGWTSKITAVGRDLSGNFTFTENGVIQKVKGDASGAQKEFIGTAIRIGLGMALKGDNALLILDEPTAGMKEHNADRLANALLSVAGQKVIITHRQSEKLTAANILTL